MTRILLVVRRSRACPLRARWGSEQRDQVVSRGYPLAATTWTSAGRYPSQTILANKESPPRPSAIANAPKANDTTPLSSSTEAGPCVGRLSATGGATAPSPVGE